jgi:colicin import membrane protein
VKPPPKRVVLPKQAPAAVPKRRAEPKPDPLTYDDALSALREELGEELVEPAPAEAEASVVAPEAAQQIDPELASWVRATRRHLRERWVTPPEFLNRGLVTVVEVTLATNGAVRGDPRVVRSSGDPYWDENAVRAMLATAPLPAPPSSGVWTFVFHAEQR